jgi:hypothetical protein
LITLVSRICITVMSITVTVVIHLRNGESPLSVGAGGGVVYSVRIR